MDGRWELLTVAQLFKEEECYSEDKIFMQVNKHFKNSISVVGITDVQEVF